jgi:hypothetical protein
MNPTVKSKKRGGKSRKGGNSTRSSTKASKKRANCAHCRKEKIKVVKDVDDPDKPGKKKQVHRYLCHGCALEEVKRDPLCQHSGPELHNKNKYRFMEIFVKTVRELKVHNKLLGVEDYDENERIKSYHRNKAFRGELLKVCEAFWLLSC